VGYQFSLSEYYSESHTVGLAGKLNQAIRFLHKKYRNFNPDGKYLIFGNGVIDLTINLFRTWSETEGKALYTYLNAPYFYQLPNHCNSANFACVPTQNETLDPSEVTEWVVVPNNPDGKITNLPHYNTKMWAKDLVYYWPHLSGVGYNMVTDDSPIAVFSFTKFTGHAGVRFGWAFVSDITLAQDLAYRIRRNVYHYSASNLYHALTIINDINANGIRFFDWAIALLQSRWSRYESMLAQQSVFKVESVRGTQYLWLSSGGRTEEELVDAFYEVKISPMFGNSFGSPGYVRINMLEFEDVFTAGLEGVLRVAQLLDRKYIDDEYKALLAEMQLSVNNYSKYFMKQIRTKILGR